MDEECWAFAVPACCSQIHHLDVHGADPRIWTTKEPVIIRTCFGRPWPCTRPWIPGDLDYDLPGHPARRQSHSPASLLNFQYTYINVQFPVGAQSGHAFPTFQYLRRRSECTPRASGGFRFATGLTQSQKHRPWSYFITGPWCLETQWPDSLWYSLQNAI